jgi:transcriptional regulator with XRE-family HTH domain
MQYPPGVEKPPLVRYCEHMQFEYFGQRLKAIREGQFIRHEPMGLRELARQAGLQASTLSQWESGLRWRDKLPPGDDLRRLATALGLSLDQLIGEADEANTPKAEPLPEIQTVPLAELLRRIGAQPVSGEYVEGLKASAGKGSLIPQGFDESRPLKGKRGDKLPERMQIVEVEGRCMEDLLFPGDLVHVDTQQTPNIGDIVAAVRFHAETIVKYLRAKDDRQYFEGKDGTVVPFDQYTRILGPVKWVQRRIQY